MESTTSVDSREPQFIAAGDIRKRLSDSIAAPKKKFTVKFLDIFICCLNDSGCSVIIFMYRTIGLTIGKGSARAYKIHQAVLIPQPSA